MNLKYFTITNIFLVISLALLTVGVLLNHEPGLGIAFGVITLFWSGVSVLGEYLARKEERATLLS